MEKIKQGHLAEKEERQAELRKEVARVNFKQVSEMFQSDMKVLQENLPGPREAATETALDMKYLRDRQAKGRAHVTDFCAKNLILHTVTEDLDVALPKFMEFLDSMRGIAGKMRLGC